MIGNQYSDLHSQEGKWWEYFLYMNPGFKGNVDYCFRNKIALNAIASMRAKYMKRSQGSWLDCTCIYCSNATLHMPALSLTVGTFVFQANSFSATSKLQWDFLLVRPQDALLH